MVEFRGGDKLQAKLKEMAKKLGKGAVLKVGFLENATYPDGTPVAMVAAIQNFGAPAVGVPPRPFFSNMVADKNEGWGGAIEQNLVAQDYDAGKTLALVGAGIKGQLQEAITDTNTPPLKPATVKRKGFDKPLIDTGHMQSSVDFEVNTDGS